MAVDKKHEVRVNVQVLELSKAGSAIRLEIFAEGEKLGEIEIGHGSFGWRKASGKRGFQRRDWSTFTDWLNEMLY
ncbi:MAG: hypothetical protein DMF65_04845 [Acidobacteria bacterium]|nr:MAG: hypothetical protein DMF65_04845 [Acidobacteriota bacterium]